MIYPWQHEQWQQLKNQENCLPHALLFLGIRGIGKLHFAECFMRAQLCQQTALDSCDCHSCRLILVRAHPNVLWIEPEKPGSPIKIDQIRAVTEFIQQTSFQGEMRFVVIHPASNMNMHAANALLKTLEEPSSGAILILIAEQASHLPATILSRCQSIHFPRPKISLSLEWLAQQLPDKKDLQLILRLANGAPLLAIELVKNDILSSRLSLLQILIALTHKQADPIQSAVTIKDMETLQILDFTLTFIMDLLRLHLTVDEITNQDFIPQLKDLHQHTKLEKLTQYMDYLLQLRGQLQIGINLNKQLMIESMLIHWMECR